MIWISPPRAPRTTSVRMPSPVGSAWAVRMEPPHQGVFSAFPSSDKPSTFTRTKVSSPHNWVSFFDIALRALDMDQHDHTGNAAHPAFTAAGTGGKPNNTGDISYADDLVSTAASLLRLQRDILLAFTVLFDIKLSLAKL